MFQARYDSKCPACDEDIFRGSDVSMVDSDRGRVTIHTSCEQDAVLVNARERTDHTTVMPRGKKAADRCPVCFQVPASNDTCGCF
jgi:hypothetical protein